MLKTRDEVFKKIDQILAGYNETGESYEFFKKISDALSLMEKKKVSVNNLTEEQRVRFKQYHKESRIGGVKDSPELLLKKFIKSEQEK